MNALSYIALVLLSLVGYSGGATGRAGKSTELKPKMIDLVLVLFIWTGAIYSRVTFDFNKWLLILIWLFLSIVFGVISVSLSAFTNENRIGPKDVTETWAMDLKKVWQSWSDFAKRMGGFQSRILLSLFFFGLISPFAIAAKLFSDPLRLKYRKRTSWWTSKEDIKPELEEYRRQF